ncbi:hypothetical protein [Catenibacillus scindens]|uniref:hypothetical protein n=1 Tax=Catenibacillus scindens TaxID=673271 RepID=UPI003208CDCA
MQEEIRFHYGRILLVLDPYLMIPRNPSTGKCNFYYFSHAIQMMYKHNLTPYLDLSYSMHHRALEKGYSDLQPCPCQ